VSSIPWMKDVNELSTGEFSFLLFMLLIGCMIAGFIIHAIVRDAGFGPAPNGVLASLGACAGIYLRYRLLAPYRADDLPLTIGFAIGAAFLLFLALAYVRSRVF
jgi:uncharacterized membrane protein YeaQ/YmgE (transglycosylase-associated protein family)